MCQKWHCEPAGIVPAGFVFYGHWLAFHEEEAYKAWNLAVQGQHFEKIAPMK